MQQHATARGSVKRALMVELKLLRITLIGVGSSKHYLRKPRLITVVAKWWVEHTRKGISEERVRGGILGRGTAIVHLVAI